MRPTDAARELAYNTEQVASSGGTARERDRNGLVCLPPRLYQKCPDLGLATPGLRGGAVRREWTWDVGNETHQSSIPPKDGDGLPERRALGRKPIIAHAPTMKRSLSREAAVATNGRR